MLETQKRSTEDRTVSLMPLWIAVAVTPIALLASGWIMDNPVGGFMAILLFPIPVLLGMLSTLFFDCPETGNCSLRWVLIIGTAIVQFPIYGLLYAVTNPKVRLIEVLLLLHFLTLIGIFLVFLLLIGLEKGRHF